VSLAAVRYVAPDQDELVADEPTLTQAFGLLTQAHYRTSPSDLARLVDAPNLRTRLLLHGAHVVAVALVALEGGLDEQTRSALYLGRRRLRGNMLPECLVSHLGHPGAGAMAMARVVRVAVHPALRRLGLGTALLDHLATELRGAGVSLLGTGFAATADLLPFWASSGYRPVRLGLRRSRSSGEHAVVMLRGLTAEGGQLADKLTEAFSLDAPWILGDALRSLDPDVALAVLAASPRPAQPDLHDSDWRALVATAFGHRLYDGTVRQTFRLCAHCLCGPTAAATLSHTQRRRLLMKVIQRRQWPAVAEALHEDLNACMRALRASLAVLVQAHLPPRLEPLAARFRRARARR